MKLMRTHKQTKQQRGAAFLVMLIILIMGVTFYLVSALNKVTMQTARNEKSADMLAQAKEVVIGYMLVGKNNPPGWMQTPDVLDKQASSELRPDGSQGSNYDGEWEGGCLNIDNETNTPPYTPLTTTFSKMRCLGRLPWKSFNMQIASPSENDPLGQMPWYAFSRNLMDGSNTVKINSELLDVNTNWLTVRDMNGNVLSNRVAFLIIIPGPPLPGQSRPPSPNLSGPAQYLDNITVPSPCTAPCTPGVTYSNYDLKSHDPFVNGFVMGDEHRWIADPTDPSKQIEDPNYNFNDKMIYVTIDEIMPLIEKRIAREAKACLDDYAAQANNNGKYPWAVPVSDTTNYLPAKNTQFGRLPVNPNIFNTDPNVLAMLNALAQLQTALNNYIASNTATTRSALSNKGNQLENLGENPAAPITSTIGNAAKNTGDNAKDLAKTPPQSNVSNVQNGINSTLALIASAGFIDSDTSMSTTWPASCSLVTSSDWDYWRDLVFYQIADGYKPGTPTPACGTCLSISGSGNPNNGSGTYHAVVIIAGKTMPPQDRSSPIKMQDRNNYLEGLNTSGKTNIPTTTSFETYRTTDSSYQNTANDLVICLDGKINCK